MSLGRWLSLGIGLFSALLVGALLLYCQYSGYFRGGGGSVSIVIAAAIAGTVLGLGHWIVLGRLEADLHRLIAHVQAIGSDRGPGGGGMDRWPLTTGRWSLVAALAEAVGRSVGSLRRRIDQLVTQRRELEVQVHLYDAELRHLEAILNSITDAVVVTDAFNEVVLANEAAARVLGFDLEQALYQPVDRVITDPTLVKLIKDTREAGDASLRRQVEHRLARNGQYATFNVTLACVTAAPRWAATREAEPATGQPKRYGSRGRTPPAAAGHRSAVTGPAGPPNATAGVVTILRDITREKEIAEMKSDFVSNVSHELRTPLSSIKAYMEMLVDGEADDEQTRAEFYNIIQGETNRLSRLIENILNISRIESGVVKVQREHISLPQLVKEVLDVMQPQARAKRIELVERPTPLYFQVFADKDMIYQAVLNLVGNAIKYTPEQGRVEVSISVDEHARAVCVHVTDTGVGVPPGDLPHLFGKFYRVANHKKVAKGTGLGLNLVKHIIETVHNGKVWVQSEVGVGSTFTFSLPIADNGY